MDEPILTGPSFSTSSDEGAYIAVVGFETELSSPKGLQATGAATDQTLRQIPKCLCPSRKTHSIRSHLDRPVSTRASRLKLAARLVHTGQQSSRPAGVLLVLHPEELCHVSLLAADSPHDENQPDREQCPADHAREQQRPS